MTEIVIPPGPAVVWQTEDLVYRPRRPYDPELQQVLKNEFDLTDQQLRRFFDQCFLPKPHSPLVKYTYGGGLINDVKGRRVHSIFYTEQHQLSDCIRVWIYTTVTEINDRNFEDILDDVDRLLHRFAVGQERRLLIVYDRFICTQLSEAYFRKLVNRRWWGGTVGVVLIRRDVLDQPLANRDNRGVAIQRE